ncbi:S24 family peptidase [Campylobacter pinnipediorum]|uniref:S24 family peptidase n=1 Tax=Campylobacter pinnipediorum TaxID=1965231 RepID=UPI00084D9FE7|nr:S24 family peptidase [Campylobacter pinnipediorum]
MNMNEINERLKDILATEGRKNIKDADVARELGISPSSYAQMKFRNTIPYKEIMDFLSKRNISINLFFYNQDGDSLSGSEKRYKTLKMFNVKASLGGGGYNDDEEFEEVVIDKKILKHFDRGNCGDMYEVDIISAMGDSMQPHICDGDLCVIGKGMPFKDGNIYAVNTDDGLVIKECYKQKDELMLVSYNPSYTPIRLKEYEYKIVGMFVGLMRNLIPIK